MELKSPVVLLVDDETAVRNLTAAILRRTGHQVIEAEDGATAMQLFMERTHEIDVVVTDLNMPELDGGTLVELLRRSRPDVPILAISGMNLQQSPGDSRQSGPFAFLPKPFTIDSLVAAVRQLLPSG